MIWVLQPPFEFLHVSSYPLEIPLLHPGNGAEDASLCLRIIHQPAFHTTSVVFDGFVIMLRSPVARECYGLGGELHGENVRLIEEFFFLSNGSLQGEQVVQHDSSIVQILQTGDTEAAGFPFEFNSEVWPAKLGA